MRIASVTISNFRCFGPEPSTVYLDRLTCLIGANGSGKSAVLQALAKLFGVLPGDRSLRRTSTFPRGSEEVILPRVAEALDVPLDTSFVSDSLRSHLE